MDVFLPEYQYLYAGPKYKTRMQELKKALALPEEATTYLLEILKFGATVALIMVTAVLLMMAG